MTLVRGPRRLTISPNNHDFGGARMPQFTGDDNKEIVREAFDTLFNRRDYAAAERF